MINKGQKFRDVYLVSAPKDTSALQPYCKGLKFLSNSGEHFEELVKNIRINLREFNPQKDAIVPYGPVVGIMIAGTILREYFPDEDIWIGIYLSQSSRRYYRWEKIKTGGQLNESFPF